MNRRKVDPFHERCTVMNLQRTRRVSSTQGQRRGQKYVTLVARSVSTRKYLARMLSSKCLVGAI